MRYNNRNYILFASILGLGILAILPSAFAATANVVMSPGAGADQSCVAAKSCFSPNVINIAPGDTVTWYNNDKVGHTTTSGHPSDNQTGTIWDSSVVKAGSAYSFTFQNVGTYDYFCMVHPWMTGEIIVGQGAPPTSPPTSQPTPTLQGSNIEIDIHNGASDPNQHSTFYPPTTDANVGDTIVIGNGDTVPHEVASGTPSNGPDGKFDSGTLNPGQYFSYKITISDVGKLDFYDKNYQWMVGTVLVSEAPTGYKVLHNVGADAGDGKTTFDVQYQAEKNIISATIGPKDHSLNLLLIGNSAQNSNLLIRLPNALISPPFLGVQLNGQFTQSFTISQEQGVNVFSIPISAQTQQVSIIGSAVIGGGGSATQPVTSPPPTPTPPPPALQAFPINKAGVNAGVIISNGAGSDQSCVASQNCFSPNVINIAPGDTVTWTNNDKVGHTSTSGNPSDNQTGTIWDSSLIKSGGTYSFTFQSAGDYRYFCMVHPWMLGEVIVRGVTGSQQISVTTDKSSYQPGDMVTITIQSQSLQSGQTVAIMMTDPSGNIIASRTLTISSQNSNTLQIGLPSSAQVGTYLVTATASVSGTLYKGTNQFTVSSHVTSSSVTIVSVQATTQEGIAVSTFSKGTTGFAKVVLSSKSSQAALVTVNLSDSGSTSLGVGTIKMTLPPGQTEIQLSFIIPSSASSGTGTVYADVFSDWPTNGGTPLTGELSGTVGILGLTGIG
jgi:plastocyanin